MASPTLGRLLSGNRRRYWRRRILGMMPVVVWFSAIVAAWYLYPSITPHDAVRGYAEHQPITLSHLEEGVVHNVQVQLHQEVETGQILVTMDDRQERVQLEVISADIMRLRAEVAAERARLQADDARAESQLDDLSRRFLVDREAARVAYLSQVLEDAQSRVLVRGAQVEYDVVSRLHDGGHAPLRELNDARTELESIKARVEHSKALLETKQAMVDEAEKRLLDFRNHAAVDTAYDPVLTPIRLAAEVRQKELEELVLQIDQHVLRAPSQGQITSLFVRPGDRVLAGDPLAVVSPVATRTAIAYLPETQVLTLRTGDPVLVRPVATAHDRSPEYEAVVVSLSAAVDKAPVRYQTLPNQPVWGRSVVVALKKPFLIPGEAVLIRLR